MKKPPLHAAGGAMPAEDLEHIADAIHQARNLMTDAAGLYAAAEEKLASARAALAIPAPVDPIYAAIERHKVAYAAYVEATYKLTVPEQDAYDETYDDDDRKALEAFLATVPTTLAGLHAALAYAVEVDSDCEPDNAGRIAATLLQSPLFAGMPATVEQMSAMDFEPWEHLEDGWKVPSNEQWMPFGEWVLPNVRIAWVSMFKTKGELENVARALDGDTLKGMVSGIGRAREAFQDFVNVLSGAESRIICAAASALAKDDTEDRANV